MNKIIVNIRLFFLIVWIFFTFPVLIFVKHINFLSVLFNKYYFKIACFILGIRVKIRTGKIIKSKHLLIVSNHISYFDIFALGSVLKVNFVAKKDVSKWPVFGLISRLGNTVFISREKSSADVQIDLLEKELLKRKIPLIIFPEGTSSEGNEVLPFKSSMFYMFEKYMKSDLDLSDNIQIQPISIAYTYNGKEKLNSETRKTYAWYIKEQSLTDHLINALKHSPFTVEIIIHDPVNIKDFNNRKDLSCHCHNIVEKGFNDLLLK